jgi:hypothetical protein
VSRWSLEVKWAKVCHYKNNEHSPFISLLVASSSELSMILIASIAIEVSGRCDPARKRANMKSQRVTNFSF